MADRFTNRAKFEYNYQPLHTLFTFFGFALFDSIAHRPQKALLLNRRLLFLHLMSRATPNIYPCIITQKWCRLGGNW